MVFSAVTYLKGKDRVLYPVLCLNERLGGWAEADTAAREEERGKGRERTSIPREGGREIERRGGKGDICPLRQTHTVTPSPLKHRGSADTVPQP